MTFRKCCQLIPMKCHPIASLSHETVRAGKDNAAVTTHTTSDKYLYVIDDNK